MTRLYLWLARHRLIAFGALALNALHPLIHGTPLDGGALDACITGMSGAALCQQEA